MKFDITIIGGGMVGGALAYTLSQGPWQIALVDESKEKVEDARLIALNEGSCCLLKNIGIWPALTPFAAPIKEVHVSHRGHFGMARITAKELKLEALGHVVPASHINTALFTALKKTNNVKILCPATLTSMTQHDETTSLTILSSNGEKTYTSDIVIGADGSHSTVRQLLGISTQKIDYEQSALVTITTLARDHRNIAYERFLEKGAIAMLPLTGTRVATIWTAEHADIMHLMQLSDLEFLQLLQQKFGYRLGRLLQSGKRATYPLQMQQAEQQQKQNVLLIGNAAHTVHPIAAQGLNIALHEVALLTDYLLTLPSLKGSLKHLPFNSLQQNFSRRLSHSLTALFSKDILPINIARQLGILGFDQCVPLKKKFASLAMGKAGQVPKLFLKNTE